MTKDESIFENGVFELAILDYLDNTGGDLYINVLSYIRQKCNYDAEKFSHDVAITLAEYSKSKSENKVYENYNLDKHMVVQTEEITDVKSGAGICHMIESVSIYLKADSMITIDTFNDYVYVIMYNEDEDNGLIGSIIENDPEILGIEGKDIEYDKYHISDISTFMKVSDKGFYKIGVKLDLLDEDFIMIKCDSTSTMPLFKQPALVNDKIKYIGTDSIIIQQYRDGKSKITHFGYRVPREYYKM